MIAIGIGCRSGARKEAIISLVAEALARAALAPDMAQLFTFDGKTEETGLAAAAAELEMPLAFLPIDALRAVAGAVVTRSEAAENALGIPSVSEASALAGCGTGAYLLLPRITGDGVTCAIAGTALERAASCPDHPHAEEAATQPSRSMGTPSSFETQASRSRCCDG